jgi:hypothetical protein
MDFSTREELAFCIAIEVGILQIASYRDDL